jgi:hypothetical protein
VEVIDRIDVANDPVNWVDPYGLAPGDLFGTMTDAAIAAIDYSMPGSVNNMEEYGGYIYETAAGKFSYVEPVAGTSNSINVADFNCIPKDTKKAGIYHTHPANKPNSQFIGTDDTFTAGMEGVPIYMGTPRGKIESYKPGTNGETHRQGR